MRVLLPFAVLLATISVASDATATVVSASTVDANVVLPRGVAGKAHYARYYLLKTILSGDDLPFTSTFTFRLNKPRQVWLAFFVRIPSQFTSDPPGVQVISNPVKFPRFDHGGCAAVNVIADANTGATLGSRCNIEYLPGRPRPTPLYLPRANPLGLR